MAGENEKQLDDLVVEVEKSEKRILEAVKARDKTIEEQGEASKKTANAVAEESKRIDQLFADYKGLQEKLSEELQEKQAGELKAALERIDELEKKGQRPGWPGSPAGADDPFLAEEVKDQLKAMDRKHRASVVVDVPSMLARGGMEQKATFMSDAAVRLVTPQQSDPVDPMKRRLRIRDLMPVRPTSSDTIEYMEQTGFAQTGAASGTQTFGAAAPTAHGAAAPEAQLEFTRRSKPVIDIAHWIPATRQVLNDVPMLRSYVDDQLVYGLQYVEEQQLLYGDGTDPNLEGLMVNASRQTYAWSDGALLPVPDTKLDAIRRAATKAYISHYFPNGVVLHPTEWEEVELTKGDDGHYIWLQVPNGNQERVFRMSVVVTTAIVAGDGLVGAFSSGATLWDREQASVRVSESHEDFFVRGMVAILGSERVGLENRRPDAFVDIDFDAEPS